MMKPTTQKSVVTKPAARNLVATKLTDTQRAVLAGAAQRDDGASTLPERVTEKAAQKLAATLIHKGLVREVRAKGDMPIWRRNGEGRASALVVTKLGREAIKDEDDHHTHDDDVATPMSSSAAGAAPSQTAASSQSELSIPRQGSKLAEVIALLGRKQGVGIEELTSTTGWLPHTARAALTGLRKRGFAIERSRADEGGSVYRIVMSAAPAVAA